MKSKIKKLIIIVMVFITCFNISFPLLSYGGNVDLDKDFQEADQTWSDVGGTVIDGIVGILTWIPRATFAAITMAFQTLITQLCGFSNAGYTLMAEDILFTGISSRNNQVDILNINFFDFSASGANKSIIKSFREGVATWYYALRNLAIVVSLAVLIYIGIRMAISSVASEKAMYKKMLVDWLVGFIILFFLHYIIMLVIIINNQLVDLIYSFSPSSNSIMSEYSTQLVKGIFAVSFVKGWGCLVVYLMLFGTTLALFVMYAKRLFTIGFLIVISPLITITYAIDRLGDGKSQALGTWVKEFSYNVLIQPFHCIIYMVFVSSTISALSTTPSLANMIFSILAILFIFKAEGIVKKIFGFESASSMEGMVAAGALIGNAMSKYNSIRESRNGKETKSIGTTANKHIIQRKPIPEGNNPGTNQNGNTANPSPAPSNGGSNANGTGGNGAGTQNGNSNNGTNSDNSNNSSSNSSSYLGSDDSRRNRSALGRAMSDYIKDKKDNFREFKANPKDALLNSAKQIPIRQLAFMSKYAPKLAVGAITAGATGNGMTAAITGYSTPTGKFTRKLSSYVDEDLIDLKLAKERKRLATAYENYKMANSDLSDEQLYNKCADLLEVIDTDKIKDKNERELAKQLQGIELKLSQGGIENANVKVMDAVEDIQLGNIKNSFRVNLDSVANAANKIKKENPSIDDSKIMQTSREFIEDIDNYQERGEKFINSDKYKALGKAEKGLAKEIYKSKKVLSAIGDVPTEEINKEIENSIEKGMNE